MVKKVIRRDFSVKPKRREDMTEKEKEHDDIYNGDTTIEKILNSKKIRYELMNQLFTKYPRGVTTVTMYIDLFSILNNIYNPNVTEAIADYFDDDKRLIISSNIINMAAHFRNYFATRQGKYTNIVFYYSLEESKYEKEVYPEYRKTYYEKRFGKNPDFVMINELIRDNIKLCEIISDYLPHIYFVNSKDINPILVPYHFMEYQLPEEMAVVYSNDKIQSLNCAFYKNTKFLTANYGNVSLYKRLDLLDYYSGTDEYNYSLGLLPYTMAIAGYKKYDISGVKGYAEKKACKYINHLIDIGILSDARYQNKEMFLEDFCKDTKFKEENKDIVKRNIDLFHLPTMYEKLSEADKERAFAVKDLVDIKSIISINDEYYTKYPLQLEELLIGEEYESVK
jgi:hypothetical protein